MTEKTSDEKQSPWSFRSGHLALDFANTADWHASDEPAELLNSYADLMNWSHDFAVLNKPVIRRLRSWAGEDPASADRALAQVRTLRETIYRIFSAVAQDEQPRRRDLDLLADAYAESISHARLEFDETGPSLIWGLGPETGNPMDLAPRTSYLAPTWPVSAAAVELLLSGMIDRVGQCRDDRGCGALFIDTSRNRSRSWCRMDGCGNRAKARRFYARSHGD